MLWLMPVQRDRFVLTPKQAEAIKFIYDGEDVFLWLPTGYRKSVCYQVLPFLFDYKLGMREHKLEEVRHGHVMQFLITFL